MTPNPETQSPESGRNGRGLTRRGLLQAGGIAAGAVAVAGAAGTAAAVAAPGHPKQKPDYVLPKGFAGDMSDLKHVVIVMQENRSFDHYLGQLPGVRGQDDKQALKFQDGTTVFQQRDASGNIVTPYVSTTTWGDNHNFYGANGGRWNTWVPDKGSSCMGYYLPEHQPFYYSLAAQYTVCDMSFCSEHGPTIPNRYYFMTGKANFETSNSGQNNYTRTWETIPEMLETAGVDWRVYSDNSGNGKGASLQSGYVGEYGCNVLNSFQNFDPAVAPASAQTPGTGIIWKGNTYYYGSGANGATVATTPNNDSDENLTAVLSDFIAACEPGAEYPLPEVSWVVMPAAWSEHPNFDTIHGERYVQKVIETLQGNQDIWNHTLLIVTYDENDGKFDHVLPPRPEADVPDEWVGSTPVGYGPRVPMTLVSPWTRGGHVASEVFDHTSTCRFLEVWAEFLGKPFTNPNITAWRRAISGDLTSAIDFAHPQLGPATISDPTTGAVPPLAADKMKPRPLSFHGHTTLAEDRATGQVTAKMTVKGGPDGKALSFQVFPDTYQAFSNTPFTVTAAAPRTYTWDATATDGKYAFSIYSHDGFVRSFAGQLVPAGQTDIGIPRLDVDLLTGDDPEVRITLHNDGSEPVSYTLAANDYLGGSREITVAGGKTKVVDWPTENGYYDVVVTADTGTGWTQRYAGRIAAI
ncbi:MAG TPA: alkaline phosphatase family protein [Gryllotalpicola sp.]